MRGFKLDLYPAIFSQEYAPKLQFGIKNCSPNDLDCREKPTWYSCWLFTLEHLPTATRFPSPPPTLNPEFYQGLHMSPCCFWTALLYLYPVRGWHCSCRSLCPQIQWHAEWGVSSQWSGCVRSWWGVAGSESTGWRIGSVLRQDQLWQCVWQWDLSKDRGGCTVNEHR